MVATGSKCDHAHFRSGVSTPETFKLGRLVGPVGPHFGSFHQVLSGATNVENQYL